MSLVDTANGRCGDGVNCGMMNTALGTSDEKAKTGLVQGVFPPNVIAVRCKGTARGTYRNLILRLCPWCGAKLPQGSK